ncbi:acyl carrier protein [Micromonospora sp. NBC_01813]|uniref:acyl carrier protein n=1 Tax=Micromonospora sp. NBC_01813 TaxID=2975988 RepID=UPI002DDB07C9|nr:acyl carrier protein [Micromonospora sp. NBC_01813]WSA07941.1 acyl carrier protein [Micromonospora sp. NBC_01813]
MTDTRWPPGFENLLRTYLTIDEGAELTPEMSLAEHGLDSMATVSLLLDLEGEYAVTIADDRLMDFVTTNVGGLWKMLADAGATPLAPVTAEG